MATDFEIGRVVAVDTAQVSIELNRDLKGMSRNTYEGPQEVGRINSYVIIPVGARRLVAMVTRVVLVEEAEMKADRTMVALPAARRLMKATLIGTIDGASFRQGVSLFPVLDNPVHLAGRADLDAIFGPIEPGKGAAPDPEKPGYCIPIGESAVVQGRPIRIDPDAFFGKHAAILGSTGSGKSCTIASLLQSICEQPRVKRTTCVILDTNGEYRAAFQRMNENGEWLNSGPGKCLYIPSDQGIRGERLVIPYWFLNASDFTRLYRAAHGVQRPVLLDALTSARLAAEPKEGWRRLRDDIVLEANAILGKVRSSEGKDARVVRQLCDQLLQLVQDGSSEQSLDELHTRSDVAKPDIVQALEQVRDIAREGIKNEGEKFESYEPIGAGKRRRVEELLHPLLGRLAQQRLPTGQERGLTPDTPSFFDRERFRRIYLDEALSRHEATGGRARDSCATMLLRIDQLCEDARFEFLFGSTVEPLPPAQHVLAAFLRDALGIGAAPKGSVEYSNEDEAPKGRLPFYDRQRSDPGTSDVVILDLSLLAAEVLENVTALIGRLILELLQRVGEYGGEEARGSLPVVLVLEEAQNYIQHPRFAEEDSIARVVFERIAREGRKYGLSLVVASQRPSELSKTVLSQCNSFIVHRLQNPEDLRYFKEIVPEIYGPMLDQIPALAPQTALVLGECVSAPALVKIREARPVPRSRDPRFYRYWVADSVPAVDVERVCEAWEGTGEPEDDEVAE